MNKYLIVDLLPSEWNKVTQRLLLPLARGNTTPNKLSQDLMEHKLIALLRKHQQFAVTVTDISELIEACSQSLAPRDTASISVQTLPEEVKEIEPVQAFAVAQGDLYASDQSKHQPDDEEWRKLREEAVQKEMTIREMALTIKQQQETILSLKEQLGQLEAENASKPEIDNVVLETSSTDKLRVPPSLERVFMIPKLLNKVTSYLADDWSSLFIPAALSKPIRLAWYSELGPIKSLVHTIKLQSNKRLERYRSLADKFHELTSTGHTQEEYFQFLLFKYLEKQVKPAVALEPVLIKAQQLINTINDETTSLLFNEAGSKSSEAFDEQDNLEKLKILTLKQIDSVLSRQLYNKGEAPESILKMKKENYEKSLKRVQATMIMFNQKLDKTPNLKMVAQQCFLYFTDLYFKVVFVMSEFQEMHSLKDYLVRELWNSYCQLETLEHQVETLQITNQTLSASKEFLYNRSMQLETNLNQTAMDLLTCKEENSKMSTLLKKLAEEIRTSRATIKSKDEDLNKAKVVLRKLIEQKSENERYRACFTSIWDTVQSLPELNNRTCHK